MESVKKVTDIVAEIAAASEEQSAGIEQVNNAVTQMDGVTQQNAALVEQSSAASKAMQQQATSLIQQIGFFRTSHEPAAAQQFAVATPKAEKAHRSAAPVRPMKRSAPAARPAASSAPAPLAKASGDDSSWQEF